MARLAPLGSASGERRVRALKARGSRRRKRRGGEVWRCAPSPERLWILNRRILVQAECFLYSSPKAGLNAVLGTSEGKNAKHYSNLYSMIMNDRLLPLLGLHNCYYLCIRRAWLV